MEKLTFIIPCFNQVDHTKKCINSIISNSSQDFNFVFIDNGSTDETNQFLNTIPNSIIIRNEKNLFVNPAWNQGFKCVLDNDLGEYVCLCNNDIEVCNNWLDPIFALFSQNRKEWYIPTSNSVRNNPFHDTNGFNNYVSLLPSMPLKLIPVKYNFVGCCMFIRKKYIKYFYPVPEEMKVIHGDDWITDCITHESIHCFQVSHCAINHFGSATQKILPLNDIHKEDLEHFRKLTSTTYVDRKMDRIFNSKLKDYLL